MNKSKMSNEYKLIFLCTRLEINDSIRQEIRKLLNSSIDWNKIIEISNRHEILPFLYYNLNKLNLQNIILQDIFAKMQNCYYANLYRNLVFEKEISLIMELTNREGISIIPFKGFSLIQTLYHNPALRIMADVDILIKKNEFQKIKDILTQLNYKESQKNIKDTFEKEIVFSKRLSSNQSLIIEIHHVLIPSRPHRINLPYLWERIQEKTINNQKIFFLSQEDIFLSLALHLRRHTRRLTLKFIVDIAELLNTNRDKLDWAYIKESARNNRIITPVYSSLYFAKELLEANVSPKILKEFRPNIIKGALIHFTINRYNFFTPLESPAIYGGDERYKGLASYRKGGVKAPSFLTGFTLKKWQGTFLRLLLFDSPIDFFLYLWRVSFLERFINRWRFKKDKENITKKILIDAKEKIKK